MSENPNSNTEKSISLPREKDADMTVRAAEVEKTAKLDQLQPFQKKSSPTAKNATRTTSKTRPLSRTTYPASSKPGATQTVRQDITTDKLNVDSFAAPDRTVRVEQSEIKLVFDQPKMGQTQYKLSPEDTASTTSIFGETGRIARTIFDKRMNVDDLIEANSSLKIRMKKAIETETGNTSKNLSLVNESYDIVTNFAEGGQGIISSAIDRTLNRLVAIKSLKKEFCNDDDIRNNFVAEAKVTAQLDHPSIVPIYSLSKNTENGLFLGMKLINGQNFKDYLDQICTHYKLDGIANFDEHKSMQNRLDIFIRVCEAMEYAHSRNVMHRDLKPENIMIGEYHETYVMDWGIARLIREPGFDPSTWVRPKQISGTPRFLSPESINGEYCDHRADIYTLGLILFEAVTLKPAFPGNTSVEAMANIRDNNMEKLEHRFGHKIDFDLKSIIWKATDYDRDKRYQTVSELAEDLRRYMNGDEVSSNPDNILSATLRWTGKHRKMTLLVTFALLFLTASVIAWSLYEKMNLAIINRLRDATITEAYSQCVSAAYSIDRQIAKLEQTLDSFGWETIFLMNGASDGGGSIDFLPYTVFTESDSKAPSSLVYSKAYSGIVDFENVAYQYPETVPFEKVKRELEILGPLKQRFSRFYFNSKLNVSITDSNFTELKKNAVENGMPVYWIYFGLTNGLQLCYPGNNLYSPDYDSRTRPWYKDAERADGKVIWGMPYRDTGDQYNIVITGSLLMTDMQGQKYGVAAVDTSLRHIIKLMNELGNVGDFVIEKYLLDQSGRVVVNTKELASMTNVMADGEELVLKPFPDRQLIREIRQKRYGVTSKIEDGEEYIYAYSSISSFNWTYIEKIKFQPLYHQIYQRLNQARKQ